MGIRKYKPTTPGRRGASVSSFEEITRYTPEESLGVKVLSVNTLNRPGKRKRSRTGFGKRKDTKRAIVTISSESRTIDVFGGRAS